MLPATAISLIRGRLGSRAASSQLQTYIIQELNAAQITCELELELPDFLEVATSALPVSGTTGLVSSFPTDVLRLHESRPFVFTPTSSPTAIVHLQRRFYSELKLRRNDTGTAAYFDIIGGNTMYVFPFQAGTVEFRYYQRQNELNTNGSTWTGDGTASKWYTYHPLLLIALCGATLATAYIRDEAASAYFNSLLGPAMENFRKGIVVDEIKLMDMLAGEELINPDSEVVDDGT